VLASLSMLGRLHWIDKDKMSKFILASQDAETGGISDRPGDLPDPFHTLFGVAGLSMLSAAGAEDKMAKVNPVYCMAQEVIDRLKLRPQILKL
jgi:geranylgeranyl transferase type-2 subunit beta